MSNLDSYSSPVGVKDFYFSGSGNNDLKHTQSMASFVYGRVFYPGLMEEGGEKNRAFCLPGGVDSRQLMVDRLVAYSLGVEPKQPIESMTRLQKIAAGILGRWLKPLLFKKINAWVDLPLNEQAASTHPLCIFSVGKRSMAWWHTQLAEQLASHGFTVLVLEQPTDALLTFDAHEQAIDYCPDLTTESNGQKFESLDAMKAINDQIMKTRVQGMDWVCTDLKQNDWFQAFQLDQNPPVFMGHSRGGSTVFEWVRRGNPCSGLVLLDPAMACHYTPWPLEKQRPPCLMYTLPKFWQNYYKEMLVWPQKKADQAAKNLYDQDQRLIQEAFGHSGSLDKRVLSKTTHEDFTDAPYYMMGLFARVLGLSSGWNSQSITRSFNEEILIWLQNLVKKDT